MKYLFPLGFMAVLISCSTYSGPESLDLYIPTYYDTVNPSISYSLLGGDFLQGLVKLYQISQIDQQKYLVGSSETFIPVTGGNKSTFRFRYDLAPGIYVMHTSLVVDRGGIITERLGSGQEYYITIIPKVTTIAIPKFSLFTQEDKGFLGVYLDHPYVLPQWLDNPFKYYYTSATGTSATIPPVDPPDPVALSSPEWSAGVGLNLLTDWSGGFHQIKIKALADFVSDPNEIPVSDIFDYQYSVTVDWVLNSQSQVFDSTNPLRRSNPGYVYLQAQWDLSLEGAAAQAPQSDLLVRIVNTANGTSAPLSFNSNQIPYDFTKNLPLTLRGQTEDFQKLVVSPGGSTCVLIFAIRNKAFAGREIYVVD